MTDVRQEPLSWLVLERYALGELTHDERASVEARLAANPGDRKRLSEIREDVVALPALPVRSLRARPTKLSAIPAGLALAASGVLAYVGLHEPAAPSPRTKGGEVTLSVLSEQHGEGPSTFVSGERFKVRVTCPTGFSATLGVVVFQGHDRFEPLSRGVLPCGENLASWPGAFTLDGSEPADVCVLWGRTLAAAQRREDVEAEGVCERLLPASR